MQGQEKKKHKTEQAKLKPAEATTKRRDPNRTKP
uniref:Uncharacterized protein n=1 Tax=Arundo donax TaxID=35708 RepID=A0A0A9BL93_ARUDO